MNETSTLQDHEARLARLEGINEQINHRLDSLDRRLDQGLRWIVGIQLGSLLALGSLIISKL